MILPEPPLSCKVYTPRPLADAMVEAVADENCQRWLEPSCGTGVFIDALSDLGVPGKQIVGVDLDLKSSFADSRGQITRGSDFLTWASTRRSRFDCVVGNPPYVAVNRLPDGLKETASAIHDFDGVPVGDRSNTWYLFMIQAVRALRDGGNMAFVLPAACEYADYAALGRSRLTKLFGRVDLIRSRRPLFDGVSEGVVVLIARDKGAEQGLYRRHEVEDLAAVIGTIRQLGAFRAKCCPRNPAGTVGPEKRRLADVVDVRIGGVTGDANYFVISEPERLLLRIPESAVVPILSRGKHVVCGQHTAGSWQRLRETGEKVWLFRPERQHLRQVAVRRYLELPEEDGGCRRSRYKIQKRSPWYHVPLPENPELFFTGMSGHGLWMCVNEFPGLNATNTLYVGTFKERLARRQKYAWALSMLTTPVQKQISRAKRMYADGLSKMEPGQIAELQIPVPPKIDRSVLCYREACNLYLEGKRSEASRMADSLVFGDKT
ncbi:MAG: N-6 DNA methylase [Planctomycetota bacterium]